MKSWLQNNHIKMYLTYNEGKPVPTEAFIRTLELLVNTTIHIIVQSK